MKDQIQDIISRFGPRLAGSEAEHTAQEYIASQMKQITDDVSMEAFQAPLNAKFGKMKWYATGYLVSIVLMWLYTFIRNPILPKLNLIISLTNAIVLICDLMRNDGITDFLFRKQTSWNVSATLEPKGEVRSTLIFSGHMDSTQECTPWYKLGQAGAYFTIAMGLIVVLFGVYQLWMVLDKHYFHILIPFLNPFAYQFFTTGSLLTLVYFNFHGKIVVDGACDNLSGIIISKNVFASYADPGSKGKSLLQHTRLRFISFGSEEKGLRGSTAYCKKHIKALKQENAHIVNIDSVRLANEISIITGELMSFVTFDRALVGKTEQAFQSQNIPYKIGKLPMGGTDAIPFQKKGIPALSIIGMNMKSLDHTYHTRQDTIANVDQKALEYVKEGLVALVGSLDSKA